MCELKPQELANTAWGFAMAGQSDVSLFVPSARAVEQHVSLFNPQNLANTAWAFTTAGHSDAVLFLAISTGAKQCMGK